MTDDAEFDLGALEVEAEDHPPFRFKFGDLSFEMPAMAALPWQDQVKMNGATDDVAMRVLLGEEQYERFEQLDISGARLVKLFEAWAKYQGLKPGESPASSRSSKSTARR